MGKRMMKITAKVQSIVIIAMLILSCLFPFSVQARYEVPDNLILEKDNSINDVILKAGGEINLKVKHNAEKERLELSWTPVDGAAGYKIYQQKDREAEELIATVPSTSVNLSKAIAGDKTAPNVPQVTTTDVFDEDGNKIGMNLNIAQSKDNGTIYKHRIEEVIDKTKQGGDIVFLLDTSRFIRQF